MRTRVITNVNDIAWAQTSSLSYPTFKWTII